VKDTITFTIIMRRAGKYTPQKLPTQCPLVLLGKVPWKKGKAMGSEEGSLLGWCSRGN
jgi:hypothetical protein